jgi:hypothetical protein
LKCWYPRAILSQNRGPRRRLRNQNPSNLDGCCANSAHARKGAHRPTALKIVPLFRRASCLWCRPDQRDEAAASEGAIGTDYALIEESPQRSFKNRRALCSPLQRPRSMCHRLRFGTQDQQRTWRAALLMAAVIWATAEIDERHPSGFRCGLGCTTVAHNIHLLAAQNGFTRCRRRQSEGKLKHVPKNAPTRALESV